MAHEDMDDLNCPACGHMLDGIGDCKYYCERCGTLKTPFGVSIPKLVERCRKFEIYVPDGALMEWHRLGIAESINRPEPDVRPQGPG